MFDMALLYYYGECNIAVATKFYNLHIIGRLGILQCTHMSASTFPMYPKIHRSQVETFLLKSLVRVRHINRAHVHGCIMAPLCTES